MAPALTSQQTVDRARALLESGRGAAVPELLKLIERLSTDIGKASIGELAELIEKDGIVLTRIFAIANRLPHNPGISPVATLSQAIHQIGYNRIRSAVVSLLLLDSAGADNPPEQRDAAALALSAGLIASGTAETIGTHDPELVFACATLRNLGRILMATLSPEHYREALELARREPQVDGFRRRFGVTAVELSRRVLGGTKLPDEVLKSLRDCEPESLNGVATNHDARLLAFSDFGSRLAALTLDAQQPDEGFVRHVAVLSRRFQRLIPDADTIAKPALLHANERLRSFARCSGVSGLPYGGLKRIRHRLELISPGAATEAEKAEILPVRLTAAGLPDVLAATVAPEDVSATPAPAALAADAIAPASATIPPAAPESAASPPAPSRDAPPPAEPAVAWDAALADSASFAVQSLDQPPPSAAHETLVVARDAIGAAETWLFSPAPAGHSLVLTDGVGPVWSRVQPRASLLAEERSVFGLCLKRREVVLIHDTSDPVLSRYLPPWWSTVSAGLRAFSLVPISTPSRPVATLLLLGWPDPRRVQLTHSQVRLLQQLFAPAETAPASSRAA
ncbi:MAG: HDOD domain-containing protein [Verrucomicrobia bacterium]|nr:HDOD domain-containing protein [Verrucomicrobiota bacterium]